MSVPAFDVLTGMASYFLEQAAIKQKIQARLYDTIAPERIVALENTQQEQSPRVGTFVEYEWSGGGAAQNVPAESAYNVIRVAFRFHAFKPEDVRALFTVFYDVFTGNRYRTANDGSGKWNGKTIKQANWDLETLGMGYDDTMRMMQLTCDLVIRFDSA